MTRRFLSAPPRTIVYPSILQNDVDRSLAGTTDTAVFTSFSGMTGGSFTLVFYAGYASTAITLNTASGKFTELFNYTVGTGNYAIRFAAAYGFNQGTANLQWTGAFPSGYGHAVIGYEIANVNPDSAFDVTYQTSSHADTTVPTPPSITPTTDKTLILCAGACARPYNSSNTFDTNGMADEVLWEGFGLNVADVDIACGSYQWTSGTYSPSAFTSTRGAVSGNNAASCTVALRAR